MNRFNLISILLFFVILSSCNDDDSGNPAPAMPTEGLLAYYTLDNESIDQSGNRNDGITHKVSATSDRSGAINSAFEFNGIDASIRTTTQIDDNLANGVTFSAWIYYTGDNTARILSNYNGEGQPGNCNGRIGFVFSVTEDRRLNIFYAIDGDDYIGQMTNVNTLQTNTWYHVLGTWNGSFTSNGFELYINGVQMVTEPNERGSVDCGYLESLNPFYIGMGHCEIGECAPFEGKLDDVRIYGRALEEEEIELLAQEK